MTDDEWEKLRAENECPFLWLIALLLFPFAALLLGAILKFFGLLL